MRQIVQLNSKWFYGLPLTFERKKRKKKQKNNNKNDNDTIGVYTFCVWPLIMFHEDI